MRERPPGWASRIYSPTYLFAAFCLAHRLRCASAILSLPAADMVLFRGAPGDSDVRGRPLCLVEAVPARRERADCRRAISASMVETMSCVFICVRYQRSGSSASYVLFIHHERCFSSRFNRHILHLRPFANRCCTVSPGGDQFRDNRAPE